MSWSKHIVTWWEYGVLCISVVFSWQLPEVLRYAEAKRSEGYTVRIGGPAAKYAGLQWPSYSKTEVASPAQSLGIGKESKGKRKGIK